VYVFSRTLEASDHPVVTLVADNAERVVADLRAEAGDGEIWLFGGGVLFRSLALAGQVDKVEVTVVPILLGGGIPLLAPAKTRFPLSLSGTHTYPSGMVALTYLAGELPGATTETR
jgi:dihydrofolate reductase